MRAYIGALAGHSAGLPSAASLYQASGITARTASGYDDLLVALGILDPVPAWTTNRIKRLLLRRKIYLTDSGLVAAAVGVDIDELMRDGDLHGRLLDSFVAAQLRPEVTGPALGGRLYHVRDKDGRHETDLVVEAGRRGVIAIEVKSSAAPKASDARHLIWLRDSLGQRFIAGVVLHTGPRVFGLADRVVAAPIASLWS